MKVLVVLARPFGGAYGRWRIIEGVLAGLDALGHETTTLALDGDQPDQCESTYARPSPSTHARAALSVLSSELSLSERVLVGPSLTKAIDDLVTLKGQPDAVILDGIRVAPVIDLMAPTVASILDLDDLLSERYARQASERGKTAVVPNYVGVAARAATAIGPLFNPVLRFESRRLEQRERYWARRSDAVVLSGFAEGQQFGKTLDRPVHQWPPLVTLPTVHSGAGRDEGPSAIVVGKWDYEPSRRGLDWLIKHVWPEVYRQAPTARLKVVGPGLANPEPKPNVDYLGFVDDLGSLYASSSLAFCPALDGGGVKIKLIEAVASGCPVVSTVAGIKGLAVAPPGVRCADEPRVLADYAVELLADHGSEHPDKKAMKIYAEQEFGSAARAERVATVLDSAVRRSRERLKLNRLSAS